MVREPDATMQPTLQDNQLMSKHRVLSLKPQLRPEWRGKDGQNETEQPDHSASLGDSITSSTRIGFSVHTPPIVPDGQISRVRFETLAFFRRPSQVWRGLNAGPCTPPPFWFAFSLASRTVVALRRFYQAGRHTAK